MRDTATLVRLARSGAAGGGAAIRANEPEVVAAIVAAVDLPVVGLWKDGDTGVYITPTVRHALAVAEAGAAVIAADATDRPRPDGSTFAGLVTAVHAAGALVMADVATLAEGIAVAEGRINTPEEAAEALARGAHSVVVGTAITAPTALTSRFVGALARGADNGVDGPAGPDGPGRG